MGQDIPWTMNNMTTCIQLTDANAKETFNLLDDEDLAKITSIQ